MIDLENLKYAELQKLAKSHGLKANQKATVLKEQLSKILAAGDGLVIEANTAAAAAEPAAEAQQENKENVPMRSSGRGHHSSGGSDATTPTNLIDRRVSASPAGRRTCSRSGRRLSAPSSAAQAAAATPADGTAAGDAKQPRTPLLSPVVPSAASTPVEASHLAADAAAAVDSLLDGSLGADLACDSPTSASPAPGVSGSRLRNSTFCIDDNGSSSCSSAVMPAAVADPAVDSLTCTIQGRDLASSASTTTLLRRRTYDGAGDDMPCNTGLGAPGAAAAAQLPTCISKSKRIPDDQKPLQGNTRSAADGGSSPRRLRSRGSSGRSSSCLMDGARSPELPQAEQHYMRLTGSLAEPAVAEPAAVAGQQQPPVAGAGDDCCLLSSMKQEMSDNEMKASLMAALNRKAELRQAEIAERVAKVRAAQSSSTKQLLKDRAATSKGNTPNFASIHAKRFAKMESIQSYVARKRQKLEDSNRVLGLSSPVLAKPAAGQVKASQYVATASKDPKTLVASAPHAVNSSFNFGAGLKPSFKIGGAAAPGSSGLLQPPASSEAPVRATQGPRQGGARIVKPIRGGVAQAAHGAARAAGGMTSKMATQNPVKMPTASPAPKRPGAIGAYIPSTVSGHGRPGMPLQPKGSAAARPVGLSGGACAAASNKTSTADTASSDSADRCSLLNTTFTISSSAFDPHPVNAKKPSCPPASELAKPSDSYKRPVLKTRDQRRAEILASGKDKRLGALMQRRLADDS